jgi:uncharacterized protein YkwD
MKAVCFLFGVMVAASAATPVASSAARADDITAMISQYRREHGLPAVKTDAKLTAIAERQAKAMAASGIMDHDVTGSFVSRIADANTDSAAENIAAGTKTWTDTLALWKTSPGHNANLLYPGVDLIGVAVARNENTRYKTFWAMVVGHKAAKVHTRTASGYSWGSSGTEPPSGGSSGGSSGDASIGTMLMRALSPLRNLLP